MQLNGCKVSRQFVNQYVSISAGTQQQGHVVHRSWSPAHLGHTVAMRAYVYGYDGIIIPEIPN